jgi:UDP-N-acetylglucosamine 4,6-dehydratase
MRKFFPDVNYVKGDIRNLETLRMAMVGHDVVIHAGATKVIPVSEYYSIDTIEINVLGSQNVCIAARETGVEHVLGISTDKACHPANLYGATKMLMEKVFQEYARVPGMDAQYHLVRWGNVLESTGSVIETWKDTVTEGKPVKITDGTMTRFWLSPSQAVDYVIAALKFDTGRIYAPKIPALAIKRLLEYVFPEKSYDLENMPLRPGEKMHETLITVDELDFAEDCGDYFLVAPSTEKRIPKYLMRPYTSDTARELTKEELEILLRNE